ncbi:MAG: hypothetical protein ACTSYA_03870 [Candidatus Kariarchaeaceae archaeon]
MSLDLEKRVIELEKEVKELRRMIMSHLSHNHTQPLPLKRPFDEDTELPGPKGKNDFPPFGPLKG